MVIGHEGSAYPTPDPGPRSSCSLDEDAVTEDADEADNDTALTNTPVDEEETFFGNLIPGTGSSDHDRISSRDGASSDGSYTDGSEDDEDSEDGEVGDQPLDGDDNTEAPTAPWSDDMVQMGGMTGVGICVHTVAKVIVCVECQLVVKPSHLQGHFKLHPLVRPTTTLFQELKKYKLHKNPLGSRPGTVITAIYGLKLTSGFFSCDNCGHACKSEKRIKAHVKKSKGCGPYQQRYVQTFLPRSNRMYFGVKLQGVCDEFKVPLDPVAYLKNNLSPVPFAQTPIRCLEACDHSNFLTLEKWGQYVEGRTGEQIKAAVRERDPELEAEVRACVDRFAEDAIQRLGGEDHEVRGAMDDYLG